MNKKNWKEIFYIEHSEFINASIRHSELNASLGGDYRPISFEEEHEWIENWIEKRLQVGSKFKLEIK